MKKIRILSIDGGGIRGIIPGVILQYLENQLQTLDKSQKKIGDYFDLIAGTSTGGILACAYLVPNDSGSARYGANEALNLYLKEGAGIFNNSFLSRVGSAFGFMGPKYDVKPLENDLLDFFGDTLLSSCIKPSMITSYDTVLRKAVFFTSADAKAAPDIPDSYNNDYRLRDVARATSAAPTYFEAAQIKRIGTPHAPPGVTDPNEVLTLIDGGVYANNPGMCAYAEARKTKFSSILNDPQKPDNPTAREMIIVSLGTGTMERPYPFSQIGDAGEVKWLEPILDILMSSNAETVKYQLHQMFDTLPPEDGQDYYRLDPELNGASQEMDDTSPANLNLLNNAGQAFIAKNKDLLDKIAAKLCSHA